jgi:lactate dehydrogenase-like 2-hydroxyacid dehydrogenase
VSAASRVVLISDVFRLDPDSVGLVADAGFQPIPRHDLVHRATTDELVDALGDAWAVVAGAERYQLALFDQVPSLRAIARPGVGYDAIDVDAASRHGIAVMTTPGANDVSVAEHAVALILAVLRRLQEHDAHLRSGGWRSDALSRDVQGRRIGILGLGAIGKGVARRLRGFGPQLLATDPYADPAVCAELGIELVPIEELAARSDVLTIHVPLSAATERLVDARIIERMPRGSILVNTARGRIVDEAAMIEALRSGHLGGAGLDVYADEPIAPDNPLIGLPGVVLTAHAASFSEGAVRKMVEATVRGLVDLRDGRVPPNCINPAAVRSQP